MIKFAKKHSEYVLDIVYNNSTRTYLLIRSIAGMINHFEKLEILLNSGKTIEIASPTNDPEDKEARDNIFATYIEFIQRQNEQA